MMSARAALFSLLTGDSQLQTLGITGADAVFPGYALDVSPRVGKFVIIRFNGLRAANGIQRGAENVTFWAHQSMSEAQDYMALDAILKRIEVIVQNAVHLVGADGTLTQARFLGRSGDLRDPVYDTLTKNSEFEVLSR